MSILRAAGSSESGLLCYPSIRRLVCAPARLSIHVTRCAARSAGCDGVSVLGVWSDLPRWPFSAVYSSGRSSGGFRSWSSSGRAGPSSTRASRTATPRTSCRRTAATAASGSVRARAGWSQPPRRYFKPVACCGASLGSDVSTRGPYSAQMSTSSSTWSSTPLPGNPASRG